MENSHQNFKFLQKLAKSFLKMDSHSRQKYDKVRVCINKYNKYVYLPHISISSAQHSTGEVTAYKYPIVIYIRITVSV